MEVLWVDKILFIFFNYESEILYLSFVVPCSCYPLLDQLVHVSNANLWRSIIDQVWLFLGWQWHLRVVYCVYSWRCVGNWRVNVVGIAESIIIVCLDGSWNTNLRHHCMGWLFAVTGWNTVQINHWNSFIESCNITGPWNSLCSCPFILNWHLTRGSRVITCWQVLFEMVTLAWWVGLLLILVKAHWQSWWFVKLMVFIFAF